MCRKKLLVVGRIMWCVHRAFSFYFLYAVKRVLSVRFYNLRLVSLMCEQVNGVTEARQECRWENEAEMTVISETQNVAWYYAWHDYGKVL